MGTKMFLRIGVCVMLLGASVAGFYFLYMGPTMTHDQELLAEMEKRQRALADLERSTAGIDDINRKIKDLQDAIQFFESKLPQKKDVEQIVDQVWKLANANSLTAKTIRSLKEEKTANFSEQQIEMSLSGDFNGFYLFIQQLERMPRLTRVTDMTLDKINEHDGEMQAKLTLSIYFDPSSGGGSTATAGAM